MEEVGLSTPEKIQEDIKEEKKWCVYIHTNKINGKKYIGITCQNPKSRWGKNGHGYIKQSYFYNAIQKYGWDNFEHEILLENINYENACQMEKELIKKYNTNNRDFGYNRALGGDVNYGYTFTMSEETKEKMSKSKKGIKFTEEHKKRIGEGNRGRQLSVETRNKIRRSKEGRCSGKDNPNYGNHKLAGENNPMYGKHFSDEIQTKISQNRKGKNKGKDNYFYNNHEFSGINNKRATPIYCKQLDEMFWGAREAENKYQIAHQTIAKCCKNKRKSAGKHPITNEPLNWVYIFDQIQKDNTVVQGAISLGYVTRQQADNYLEEIKQKENDIKWLEVEKQQL